MPDSSQTLSESVNNATQFRISTLGHKDHGKTTLMAAITRVLASADARNECMTVDQLERLPVEHQQVIPLTSVEVTHKIGNRQYIQTDYPSHNNILKSLLTTSHPFAGAVLVVSAIDGVMSQVRDQVLLASKIEIPNIIIFLNKIDLVEDKDLLTVVELEIRELLSQHQYTVESSPIIQGSALQALTSQGDLSRQDPAANGIWQLLDALNTILLPPISTIDKPFLMPIEDFFPSKDAGPLSWDVLSKDRSKWAKTSRSSALILSSRVLSELK